jgi:hypothetical protein
MSNAKGDEAGIQVVQFRPRPGVAARQGPIATHSPILMAYQLGDGAPRLVDYRDTEHFTVTRNFLTRTDQMLAVLLEESEEDE